MSQEESWDEGDAANEEVTDVRLVAKLDQAAEASKSASVTVLIRSDGPVADHRIDNATLAMDRKFRARFVPDPSPVDRFKQIFNLLWNWFTLKRLVTVRFDICEAKDDMRAQLTDMLMQWNIRLDSYMRPRMASSRIVFHALGALFALLVIVNRFITPWLTPLLNEEKIDEIVREFLALNWLQHGELLGYFFVVVVLIGTVYLWFDHKSRLLLFQHKRLTNTDVFLEFIADEFSRRAFQTLPAIFFGYFLDFLRMLLSCFMLPLLWLVGLPFRSWSVEFGWKQFGWWLVEVFVAAMCLAGTDIVKLDADGLLQIVMPDSWLTSMRSGFIFGSTAYLGVQTITVGIALILWHRVRRLPYWAVLWGLWFASALTWAGLASVVWMPQLVRDFVHFFEDWPIDLVLILFLLITAGLAWIRWNAQDEKHVMILFNDAQRLGSVFSRLMDQIKGKVRRNLVMLAVWNEEECPTGIPYVRQNVLLLPELPEGIEKRLGKILNKRLPQKVNLDELKDLAMHIQKGVDS